MTPDPLLHLLQRFHDEHVEYVLVGGQAVRLNGFLRATEDIDVLIKATRLNGEKIKRAMNFLPAAIDLKTEWFVASQGEEIENIRVADDLLVDLLFSANGQTYESVQEFVREIVIEGVLIRVLDIDGLILTKTDYRDKDMLDKQVLTRIKREGLDQAD
jgi:hypothetical protein